ncbi:uncharacterized protein LOC133198722 [Saccostrea echinata]|uniref:uncharacterized protein LOC133198722 n=1 Tax=Saccostrea echinata TaxID=191078 RepID=UPI002A7FAC26|nr:uncharacterized protein LOC133198722 [Saccostrea echinata]
MVTVMLKDLNDSLHNLIERFRGNLTHQDHDDGIYLGRIDDIFAEIDERTVFTRRLRDRQVYTREKVVKELAIPMVHKLVQELEDGFHLSPTLESFSLFNKIHLHVPDNNVELQDFGNTKGASK